MQESCARDPAIKLFGKEIPLLTDGESPETVSSEDLKSPEKKEHKEKDTKDSQAAEPETQNSEVAALTGTELSSDSESLLETSVNPKTPSISEEAAKSRTSKEQVDGTNSQEKPLKKPDKILPCPRCNSMDTKFCYYNNYNVNQPRHFCRACQRYWTAGGTMRNVPVGAGRRKSKSSTSQYRHITISEALEAAHIEPSNGIHHPTLKSNGKVLSFGLDSPLCNSMVSVLNLGDTNAKALDGTQSGFHKFQEMRILVPCKAAENGDDSNSSTVVPNSTDDGSRNCKQETLTNGFASPVPCLPSVPWPCAWNSPLPPPGAFWPPGLPMAFYPPPYWNCGLGWNFPLLSPQSSSSSNPPTSRSSPDSPKLGKHSRDTETANADELETEEEPSKTKNGCVLVPKILRIDDPSEAAKSSIWATLGIKNETLTTGSSLFKGFQSKSNEKEHALEASPVLRANPAALSRSMNFHEGS